MAKLPLLLLKLNAMMASGGILIKETLRSLGAFSLRLFRTKKGPHRTLRQAGGYRQEDNEQYRK